MKKVVTKSDIGKQFKEVIEGRLVTLEKIREDGWFDVLANNTRVILPPNSLRRLDDNELLNHIIDEPKRADKLHIHKLEKVTMIGRNEKGEKVEQVLEGEDAEHWHSYVRGMSLVIQLTKGISFDFANLKWVKKLTKKA